MIPHLQSIYDGPRADIPGDCLKTAVAALLDLPTAAVPHFALFGREWRTALAAFMTARGKRLRVYSDDPGEWIMWTPLGVHVSHMDVRPSGQLLIASGDSANIPGAGHAVLWRGTTLVHDVHPLQRGLGSDPWGYYQVTDA